MKHLHYLSLAAALLVATATEARQRTEQEARALALQHITALQPSVAPSAAPLKLVDAQQVRHTAARAKQKVQSSLQTPYYIYNNPAGGFVVVSGTTALDPVIASSTTGCIDIAAMPDGLSYWLGYAAEAAKYAEEHPEAAASHPAKAKRNVPTPGTALVQPDYSKDVSPLLENSRMGNIQWAQDAPYYDQCPTKGGQHCYTGCMATAMSQVMAYHQHPASFDWKEILPSYEGGKGSAASRSEVARINHEVGVALNMEYGTDQSGSVSTMYTRALRNFGYHENVALINRDNYTYGEWMDILLNEFANNRPVVYDGVSNDGGHAFVIDGYRASDGKVHVNWGWAGMSDGYYNIILLDPQQTGIGAVLSSGFTSYQDMVVGIEPDHSKPVNYYSPIQGYAMQGELEAGIGYCDFTKGDYTGQISLSNMPNLNPQYFSGEFGALIANAEGEVVARAKAGSVSASASTMNSNPHATFSGGSFTLPKDLAPGVYRVYCYIEEGSTGKWAVARTAIDKPNFMVMTVGNDRADFTFDAHHPTGLKVQKWSFDDTEVQYGTTGLKVTVVNESDQLEYGSFALSVDVPNQLSRNFYEEFYRFKPGESKTISFPVLFDEYGEYAIRSFQLYRLNGGGAADIVEPFEVTFSVERTLADLIQLLEMRLREAQSILDRSRLSGNYPEEACDALQLEIDALKLVSTSELDADAVNALLDELEAALTVFYMSISTNNRDYWGYVNGQDSQITTSWCPGGDKPAYFGISMSESDLSAYVGGQIIGLRCLFGQNRWYDFEGDDIVAKVFLLDYDGGNPGNTLLATSAAFSPTRYATYDEYLFEKPYTIGAGGVLCCAEVTTPHQTGMFGAMGASLEVCTPGALWMNNGSGWEDMYGAYGEKASGVAIQAIIVGGVSVNDAKLANVVAKSAVVGEEVAVSGVIQNLCSSPATGYKISWSTDDGRSGSKTFTETLDKLSTQNFSLTIPGFQSAKLHTIRVAVSEINGAPDEMPSNSTADITVPITARQYVRRVVLEENTGADCGFCPRGINSFEYMKEKYGDQFIGISIHNYMPGGSDADLYYDGSHIAPLLLFLNSAPSGMFNRGGTDEAYTKMDKPDVEAKFLEQQRTCIAQISGAAYLSTADRSLSITTDTEFGYDYSDADYRIGYAILEDGLDRDGKGYTQANNYSGGSYGALDGWEDKLRNVRGIVYDDVFREFLPAYDGQPGSIPAQGHGGIAMKYTYTCTLPSTVKDITKVRVVPMIINATTHEVLNAVSLRPTVDGDNVPSGIDTVLRPDHAAPAYDLSGRSYERQPKSGVMIQDGKKHLVK